MAFKKKFDGQVSKTVSLGGKPENPSFIEGYFLGSKDTVSDFGPGKLHIFQTKDGHIGVWGKSRMNTLLTDDLRGLMVRVTFTGMVAPTKKGRRPSYGYQVEFDDENTIDVSGVNLNTPTIEDADDAGDTTDEQDFASEEEQEYVDEVPPAKPSRPAVAAAVPSPSRQSQVQALLSKSRVRTS